LLLEKQQLETTIEKASAAMVKAQIEKDQARSDLACLKSVQSSITQLKALVREKKVLSKTAFETQRRMIVNNLIRKVQSELAQKESQIGQAKAQRGIVQNLTDQIDRLKTEEKDLDILIKKLSPTEGLIAEGMLGFIKNYIDQMNDLISKIWSYTLEIQSCDIIEGESIDLDYTFPMKVHTSEKPVDDVSKGSTGMIEIVNLAFRFIAMQYLTLQNYPLYLDEAGRAFDTHHRSELGKMIRTIVEQSSFSQIFLISHYFELYGGLSNVETCVISPLNISTPAVYNQHVLIE